MTIKVPDNDEMGQKKYIKVSFGDKEYENIDFLMTALHADTPQDLVRALVRTVADEKRAEQLRYGPATTVARETKAQRRMKLEKMDDEALTDALAERHCFDELYVHEDPHQAIWIETQPTGRVLRVKTPSQGMDDTINLSTMMNQWEKKGLLT